MKTLKVQLTQQDDNGTVVVKTLTGDDAEQWQKWVDSVCLLAWNHRQNPDWSRLHWEVRKLESPKPPRDHESIA